MRHGTEGKFLFRDGALDYSADDLLPLRYVVSSTRSTFNQSSNDQTPQGTLLDTSEEPEVVVAIFPASHIHVRDELPDAEGKLAEIYARLKQGQDPYGRDRYGMETVPELDEFSSPLNPAGRGLSTTPTAGSLGTPTQELPPPLEKPTPPRPSIKSGDDTASGQAQPLVDEIASALREWHALLFTYLSRRDYKLFQTVTDHLEALHQGRRQLLSETLSAEETNRLRKACVARLVRGNIAQGLDIIVRHPTWGALVTVDLDDHLDVRSWTSAVRMYVMQASVAYTEDPLLDAGLLPRTCALHGLGDLVTPSSRDGHLSTPSMSSMSRSQNVQASRSTVKFYHVYLELKAFVASPCAPGETAELYFSLYSKSGGRFLTEEFCAILNHNGVLARDSLAKVRTLFSDLGHQDVQDTIYLVCRIVRTGALKLSATVGSYGRANSIDHSNEEFSSLFNGKGDISGFRRPFGAAVVELQQLGKMVSGLETSSAREHAMPIFVPVNEASYSTLHQDLISSNTKEFEKSPRLVSLAYAPRLPFLIPHCRADMIAVTVKLFHGDAATIIKENPSLLQETPITNRLGFPDVVFPSDVRNEVYIKLWSGEFNVSTGGSSIRIRKGVAALAGSSAGPNSVEVSVEVRRQSGQVVENAIALGTGEPPITRFHSLVFYRNNTPTYGELVKLVIPEQLMPECHLFFTFRNRSSKEKGSVSRPGDFLSSERPFAFGYLPLFPGKQAFLEDGSHTLVLYKADKVNTIPVNDYFQAPAVVGALEQLETLPPSMRNLQPLRDSFTIRSFLCSTRFTANGVLVDLLNWELLHDKSELIAALQKFTFVGEVEIVKFLRDIFDSLFGILVSPVNQNGEMDDLVFNALVTVLGIVQDRRFNNFQPVLDVYIAEHFNCAPASYHMLHSMNRLLSNPTGADTASPLRAAIRVWHYIFKFIVRSRELQKSKEVGLGATSEHLDSNFKREIFSHLQEVNRLMSLTSDSIIGTQTFALQHFPSILPELADVFPHMEIVSLATSFVNSCISTKGKIVIWKLNMYLQLVRGFLFDKPQSRALILEAVVGWIKPHFGAYDEYMHVLPDDGEAVRDNSRVGWIETTRLCMSIIAVMVDKLLHCLVDPATRENRRALKAEEENIEFLLSLLPR